MKFSAFALVGALVSAAVTPFALAQRSPEEIDAAHKNLGDTSATRRVAEKASASAPGDNVSFNRDIRPILSDNCFACHGPDKANREADLSLHLFEEATRDLGEGRRAIVPGDAGASELIKRITHEDSKERMPPAALEKTLSAEQIDTLRRWIDAGAEYEAHWAYIPPKRPAVPTVATDWGVNPIDAFIAAKAAASGVAPSEEADKRTLLRRISFDLTGLPPTPEALEAFLSDESPDAYEKAVDQLLASPHYGERMALGWLDAVRYADSWGYHSDNPRSVWPYRDYVIAAFNENKPFSQFTIEQLAGDLLTNPTREQLIATTFNHLNKITNESGAQDEEYRAKYLTDRVSTLGTVWLGATTGCAECHDHKFDPITAKDFYSLGAFFADISERGWWMFPNQGFDFASQAPHMFLGNREQEEKRLALYARVEQAKAATPYKWVPLPTLPPAVVPDPDKNTDAGKATWSEIFLERVAGEGATWRKATVKKVLAERHPAASVSVDGGVTIDPSTSPFDAGVVRLTADGDLGEKVSAVKLDFTGFADDAEAYVSLKGATISVVSADGSVQSSEIISHVRVRDIERPTVRRYLHAEDDQSSYLDLYTIIDKQVNFKDDALVLYLKDPLIWSRGAQLDIEIRTAWADSLPGSDVGGMPSFKVSTLARGDVGPAPSRAAAVLKKPAAERTAEEQKYLDTYYLYFSDAYQQSWRDYRIAEYEYLKYAYGLPYTWVTTRAEEPRSIRVLPRGDWQNKSGEVVQPAVPAFLGDVDVVGRADRLDLARWMVSAENPLTARVIVNRLWDQFFGRGLAATLEDLGSQGAWPTHPDLLDWLAVEFRESGWDLKHVIRLIVTSSTYRQSSAKTPEAEAADPLNVLFARQNAVRLPAELIRDNALAISGLLNTDIGGPSVMPYQPNDYYSVLNFPRRTYQPSQGAEQYRRGIYTHWQRTRMHPAMKAFGAPSREETVVNRANSNTPTQALTLLNDPTFVEAATALGLSLAAQSESDHARITSAFERALSRPPTQQELEVLTNLLTRARASFAENDASAHKLLAAGRASEAQMDDPQEAAAWTTVARAILNLHETITRF